MALAAPGSDSVGAEVGSSSGTAAAASASAPTPLASIVVSDLQPTANKASAAISTRSFFMAVTVTHAPTSYMCPFTQDLVWEQDSDPSEQDDLEDDDASSHTARLHGIETFVDFFERDRVGHHFVELEPAVDVHVNETGHVGTELIGTHI